MNNSRTVNLVAQTIKQRVYLENIVTRALELACVGSNEAEVTVTRTNGIGVSTRYGNVENIEFNNYGSLEIIIYYQQRKGSASSTDLSQDTITRTVTAALDIARYTSPDYASGPAEKALLAFTAQDLDLFHPIEIDTKYGITLAADAEQIALQSDKRITHTEGGKFNSYFNTYVFGNSYGMLQSYSSSCYSLSCSVVAESNGSMERNHAYTISRVFNDLRSPQWVGEECARRTLARLNPRQLKTMIAPVLFVAEVAIELFGHLVWAISGSNVYRKSTFLLDSLGKSILPDWLSIQENPHLRKGLFSLPFDSEGVRTSDRVIVQNGVLNTWLLNSYSARKLGLESTGHASGVHNLRITHKTVNFTGLLKQMGCGLVVTELMGQAINIITGDYSRGAAGFWVENGEIQYPVSGITIAGNLREMLRDIISIGNDTETRSNIQCGSLLLSTMKIAGY